MNTQILKNIESQSSAQSGARMLTEHEMDVIVGGDFELIECLQDGTFYVNEKYLLKLFLKDRTQYDALVKQCERYKANGIKLGSIVAGGFVDIPPAFYGEQGISGN